MRDTKMRNGISQDEGRFSQFKERKATATKAYIRTLREPESAA